MEKILVNLIEQIGKACEQEEYTAPTRYNGGWTKIVTGLDKTRDNGYSIQGEFVKTADRKALQDPGLYLDCDIRGSRKNQSKHYHLARLNVDGTVDHLAYVGDRRDWAIELWPAIEAFFSSQSGPEARKSEIEAEIATLEARLSELKAELTSL